MNDAPDADFEGSLQFRKQDMPAASVFGPSRRRRLKLSAVFISLFVPWFLFCILYSVMSFRIHYKQPSIAWVVVGGGFGFAVISGMLALNAQSRHRDPAWFVYVALTCLISTALAAVGGDINFTYNMLPYYTINDLNAYPAIDPAKVKGGKLMDAGRVYFTQDTGIDTKRAMGFKSRDLFCVAPIVSGNGKMASYDFWAVGVNCCSGVAADFRCGDYNKPNAHSGLRLIGDDQRAFYRLAVQQAEAAYHIKSTHPLFFHWMEDPMSELRSYYDDGLHYFLVGIFGNFAFNMLCVAFASFGLTTFAI